MATRATGLPTVILRSILRAGGLPLGIVSEGPCSPRTVIIVFPVRRPYAKTQPAPQFGRIRTMLLSLTLQPESLTSRPVQQLS